MKHQVAVLVFLSLVLVTALTMPIINLSEPSNQARAIELLKSKHWTGSVRFLYQSDRLASWLAGATWKFGVSTSPDKVVVGYDGWLHLGDQYAKTLSSTRDPLEYPSEAQAKAISAWSAWMQRQSVKSMVFMLGPNKSSIYPHTLPGWAKPSPADLHTGQVKNPPPNLLDLRYPLRTLAAASDQPLYYKTDTHWNQLGAAHAFVLLGEHLRQQDPSLAWPLESPINVARQKYRRGGDLALFLRIPHLLPDTEINISFKNYEHYVSTVTDLETEAVLLQRPFAVVDYPGSTVHVKTPAALNSRRVLWMRDSFGAALSPMMAATFDEIVQLHWHRGMKDQGRILQELVKRWQPHLVIFTVVERDAGSSLLLATPNS